MTIEEHISRLNELKSPKTIEAINNVRLLSSNLLLGLTKNRIIREGKATDGSDIGQYSHKPNYFPQKAFAVKSAFKAQGKRGKNKGAKTMYLPQGYYQFRGIQGRNNSFVNLDLSGAMMKDYQYAQTGNDIVFGFSKNKESQKRKGNEKRFRKTIFQSSKDEISEYKKDSIAGIQGIIIDTLK